MNFRSSLSRYSLVVALIVGASSAAGAQTRIYFAHGATRATVRGYLRGTNDEAVYLLRAKAGQHMRVEIKGRGPTRGMVFFPSGGQDGAPGGVVFDGIIPDTGDYRIRVTESSMANAWRGSFTLIIDIQPSTPNDGARNNRVDLYQYIGKYPSALFKDWPAGKVRLRTLLAANYRPFFDRLQTEMPIEKDGDALIVRGCMAHSCGIEEAILAINLDDGSLHCAIRFNSTFRTFSEKRARMPAALNRAMRQ